MRIDKIEGTELTVIYSLNQASELCGSIWLLAIPDSVDIYDVELSINITGWSDDSDRFAEELIKRGAIQIAHNEILI